ncbi:PH domain-containing protein [Candidatus Uhrbacteria bacterium]|nr:PH domain-containing protein [Candidatus Uhrbacteria bacterium]
MNFIKRFKLREGEQVVAVVRRSVLAYAAPAALALLCAFLAFFLIVPLIARGKFGVGIFVLLLALAIVMAFRVLWFWYWTAFVVTDARIIDSDQRGIFHRRISEARFNAIEDIAIEIRGILATVFHLGSIRIQTAGAQATIELRTVPRPELVHELLGRLQSEARGRGPVSAPTPALQLSKLSPPELTQLREQIDVELKRRSGAIPPKT